MNPWLVVRAGVLRHRWSYALFLCLIALATAIGVAVSAQEAALRKGSARAADKFDLVVAAPGSQTDVTLAAIYLRPGTVPLMSPADTERALAEPRVKFAAPLGYGDSYHSSPIIGTTNDFVAYLSGGLKAGRLLQEEGDAVVGSAVDLPLGASFHPVHGADEDDDDDGDDPGHAHHEHAGVTLTVVGRMKPTGTPWDNAIVIPIESVWRTHQLPTGHAEGETRIGPPFAAGRVPGSPAIVMAPRTINDAYGLRGLWRTPTTMAFFPAEALTPLYAVMGDVRDAMSLFALATQGLVAMAILAGVVAILSLHRRQFSVLRALGAPRRYIFACVFAQSALPIVGGALAGTLLGWIAARAFSAVFTAKTGVSLLLEIGESEFQLVGAFVVFGLLAAIGPAIAAFRSPPVEGLAGR
jgi:putative ABC transport system permease protein